MILGFGMNATRPGIEPGESAIDDGVLANPGQLIFYHSPGCRADRFDPEVFDIGRHLSCFFIGRCQIVRGPFGNAVVNLFEIARKVDISQPYRALKTQVVDE